jgi:hypothetical protein
MFPGGRPSTEQEGPARPERESRALHVAQPGEDDRSRRAVMRRESIPGAEDVKAIASEDSPAGLTATHGELPGPIERTRSRKSRPSSSTSCRVSCEAFTMSAATTRGFGVTSGQRTGANLRAERNARDDGDDSPSRAAGPEGDPAARGLTSHQRPSGSAACWAATSSALESLIVPEGARAQRVGVDPAAFNGGRR